MHRPALPSLLLFALLAGCIEEPLDRGGETIEGIPVYQSVAIEFQGKTATSACLVTPVTPLCYYGEAGTAEHVELGTGRSLRLLGNLTWTATSPATNELLVEIILDDNHEPDAPSALGKSPLAVDFDLSKYHGRNVAVGVSNLACTCAADLGIEHSFPQEFEFEGVYIAAPSIESGS